MTPERTSETWRAGLANLLFERGSDPANRREGMILSNRWIQLVCRVLLAVVFIYAALQKIDKPLMFADEIRMYRVLGEGPALYLLSVVLPWIELFCGISLLTGIFMRGSAFILAILNVVFILVISYRSAAIMHAEKIPLSEVYFDCGCGFGPTWAWKKLMEDTVFFFCALLILAAPVYRFVPGWRKG